MKTTTYRVEAQWRSMAQWVQEPVPIGSGDDLARVRRRCIGWFNLTAVKDHVRIIEIVIVKTERIVQGPGAEVTT